MRDFSLEEAQRFLDSLLPQELFIFQKLMNGLFSLLSDLIRFPSLWLFIPSRLYWL
jgi:hypothetical protein